MKGKMNGESMNGYSLPIHKLHIVVTAKVKQGESIPIENTLRAIRRAHSNAMLKAAVSGRKIVKSVLPVKTGYVQGGSQWESVHEVGKTFGNVRVTQNDTGIASEYKSIGENKSRSF